MAQTVSPKIAPGGATPRSLADAINRLADGRSNAVGSVELSTGTTTDVSNPAVGSLSVIVLSPISSSAAGVAWWISNQAEGSFRINHPSGSAGRTYRYGWIG